MTSPLVPLEDRFWARVDKTETCWLWTASLAAVDATRRFGVSESAVYQVMRGDTWKRVA